MFSERITNRLLGTIGILCAPFLALDLLMHNKNNVYTNTRLGGIFSFIYIFGWICSLIGLARLKFAGPKFLGRTLFGIQLLLLLLATGWNICQIVSPGSESRLYRALDICWPLSNLFMFVIGVAVVFLSRLSIEKRFIPLVVGLWLPLTMLVGTRTLPALYFSSAYSFIAWALFALLIRSTSDNHVAFNEQLQTAY